MALVDPIDLNEFDLLPSPPYFTPTYGSELDELNSIDADLGALDVTGGVLDLAAIAASMDGPIGIVDSAIAFELGDTTNADVSNIVGQAPAIAAGISGSESALGNARTQAGTVSVTIAPIAGVALNPPSQSTPLPVGSLPPVGTGIGPIAPAGARAFLTNLSRPGSPGFLNVGDNWQITIQAAPGAAISVSSAHNGVSLVPVSFGNTDASGSLILHGTITADQNGYWVENWYANGQYVNQIAFTVG